MTREEKIDLIIDMAFRAWQDSTTFDQQEVREAAAIVLLQIETAVLQTETEAAGGKEI